MTTPDAQPQERCDGRYPVPQTSPPREEPFEVTYRCARSAGHDGPHGAELVQADADPLVRAEQFLAVEHGTDFEHTTQLVRDLAQEVRDLRARENAAETRIAGLCDAHEEAFVRAEAAETEVRDLRASLREFEAAKADYNKLRRAIMRVEESIYLRPEKAITRIEAWKAAEAHLEAQIVRVTELETEVRDLRASAEGIRRFLGGEQVGVSTGICESTTYGYGDLDKNGYWQYPVPDALVAFKKAHLEAQRAALRQLQEYVKHKPNCASWICEGCGVGGVGIDGLNCGARQGSAPHKFKGFPCTCGLETLSVRLTPEQVR